MRKAQIMFKRVKIMNRSEQDLHAKASDFLLNNMSQFSSDPLNCDFESTKDSQEHKIHVNRYTPPFNAEESENDVTENCFHVEEMEQISSEADEEPLWTDAKVKLLLSSLEELRPKVGKSNKLSNQMKMWEVITDRFVKMNYDMTTVQIRNKYFNLMRQYKTRKTNNSKCPYERELDVLMSQSHSKSEHYLEAEELSTVEDSENDIPLAAKGFVTSEDDKNFLDEIAIWTDPKVKLLLSAYKELRPKVGKSIQLRNKTKMWSVIRERFIKAGFDMTAIQLKNKFGRLERQYNKMKVNNDQIGRRRMSCQYKSELDDLFNSMDNKSEHKKELEDLDYSEYTSKRDQENQICSSPETVFQSDRPSKSSAANGLKKLGEEKIDELRDHGRGKVTKAKSYRESREKYYKIKTEYLLRKKQHLEQKEAHMKKKEELLSLLLQIYSK